MLKPLALITSLTMLISFGSACATADEKAPSSDFPQEKGTYARIDTTKGAIVVKLFPEIAPKTVANFIGLAEGTKEFKDVETGETVKRPYYNGLIFHRVIPSFMIQGGCPFGNGSGDPGYTFEDECYDDSGKIIETISDEKIAFLVFKSVLLPYLQSTPNPDKEILTLVKTCMAQQNGKCLLGKKVADLLAKTGRKEPLRAPGKLKAEIKYGTLCMANRGPNTNGSQFFIVTKKEGCAWLNGKHTVFGEVVKGMEIVHAIESVPRDNMDKPKEPISIKSITVHVNK